MPVLFYGLKSCPINKSQTRSLDFAIDNAFSKIFCMKSRGDIDSCRMFLIVFLSLIACIKGREHFCVNTSALAVYYAAYLLVQPLMNVVRCSLFNFVIICEPT